MSPRPRTAAGAGRPLAVEVPHRPPGRGAGASPQTIASYRDAIKLLLTWFRDVEGIPPEKLRLADIDRARVLRFLDWLEAERGTSAATRNQRLAVIKSFGRYTAVERPEFISTKPPRSSRSSRRRPRPRTWATSPATRSKPCWPNQTGHRRGLRDTVLLSMLYDTAARVQEICDLNAADVRAARPMAVVIRGKGSKTRRVPVMDPTAQLVADYLDRRARHPGVGADATRCSTGRNRPD